MEFFALLSAAFLLLAMLVLLVFQQKKLGDLARQLESRKENEELAALRAQMETLLSSQSRALGEQLNILRQQQVEQGMQTEQKLENLRRTLSYSLDQVQRQNQRQLDEIRSTVDEKLQTTLEKKLNDSFAIVSQRL